MFTPPSRRLGRIVPVPLLAYSSRSLKVGTCQQDDVFSAGVPSFLGLGVGGRRV